MKYRPWLYDQRAFSGNALTRLLVALLPIRWFFLDGTLRQRLIRWAYRKEWERGVEPPNWTCGYTIFGGDYGSDDVAR